MPTTAGYTAPVVWMEYNGYQKNKKGNKPQTSPDDLNIFCTNMQAVAKEARIELCELGLKSKESKIRRNLKFATSENLT